MFHVVNCSHVVTGVMFRRNRKFPKCEENGISNNDKEHLQRKKVRTCNPAWHLQLIEYVRLIVQRGAARRLEIFSFQVLKVKTKSSKGRQEQRSYYPLHLIHIDVRYNRNFQRKSEVIPRKKPWAFRTKRTLGWKWSLQKLLLIVLLWLFDC